MEKKAKRGFDINDHSKWGHRFEFRDRSKAQRDIFTVAAERMKRPKPEVTYEESEPSEPEAPSRSICQNLESKESVPIFIPKAKTKANKAIRAVPSSKKRKEDTEIVAKELIADILDALEAGDNRISELESTTYINCDLRYFNLDYIVEKFGYFDSNFYTSCGY